MGIAQIVLITLVLEVLETLLQYKSTLKESLQKQYQYYLKSPFYFFSVQVGYIWLLFLSIVYDNLNWVLLIAIALKSFDIFTKLELIRKLFRQPDGSYIDEIDPLLNRKLPLWVYLIGPLTYPYLVYVAFE